MFLFDSVSERKPGPSLSTASAPVLGQRALSSRMAWLLLVLAGAAWLLPGIFGHGPWKQDETYSFGMIHHMLTSGEYLVPTNAGRPFMEKPPLYYWTAVLLAKLVHPLLPYHEGARLASILYNLVTLVFVARIAQMMWNQRSLMSLPVLATLALFAGSPGMVKHAHDMFTDVALVAGTTMATYGLLAIALNQERRTPSWTAAFWFGLGVGITEMSKGLFVPLTFAATALVLGLLVQSCRHRTYWKMVGLAVLVSLPFFVIWPALLAQHSVPLFMEWFWDNNVGRFFGFSVKKLGSDNDHTVILRALAGFALPGSLLALLGLASGDWRQAGSSRVAVPLVFAAISLVVLQSSATARQLYLLPVLLPLAMLGARAIPRLPDVFNLGWDWLARVAFGLMAVGIWAIYVISTLPIEHHHWIGFMGKWLPLEYVTPIQPLALLAAGAMSILWIVSLGLLQQAGQWRGAFSWFGGITLMWGLAFTLLLPWADYGKSYEFVYADLNTRLAPAWRADDCMASQNLGESEAPMLYYYTGLLHQPIDATGTTECRWVIQQMPGVTHRPKGHWTLFWEGRRDGDDGQLFKVWQRAG
ncbi:ArnT family glycosyltransferase [Herbaspirillum frisingense]|uniref:4-amino-4-deoxy-L-arabinose transferase-like glycosyltransferase n=1 Tax=Herbaspirillum frisingense TaxID=92645 RepID=A0ABU1PFQ7_9BURK|nr:glycosyl transferase [Herbaspirillum frisingense]MDR6584769.1 4-amino-4-deoxy-L-arabinose transferase-like glycosyltransferase [Herbaspirillum frisingense]